MLYNVNKSTHLSRVCRNCLTQLMPKTFLVLVEILGFVVSYNLTYLFF